MGGGRSAIAMLTEVGVFSFNAFDWNRFANDDISVFRSCSALD
jgi:hypothetical protein